MPIQQPEDIRLTEQREVQALMGDPPGWMLRYGILLVAALVLALFAIAYFVRFPDQLAAEGIITSGQPSVRVAARADGELRAVYVADRDSVAAGALLVELTGAADPGAVGRLADWLTARASEAVEDWVDTPLPAGDFGELQTAHSALAQRLQELRYFQTKDKTRREVRYLRDEITQLEGLIGSRQRQARILASEVRLAQQTLTRDSLLVLEGARSPREVEGSRTALLDKQRSLEDLRSTVYQTNIQIQELKRRILELRQRQGDTGSSLIRTAREDFNRLRGALDEWRVRHRITAPAAGRAALPRPLVPGQFVRTGETLLTLLPTAPQDLIARATLAPNGAGKVRPGMRANIRLADYPHREFGLVQGTVQQLSLLPEANNYLVTIQMPDTLVTTYGVSLPFRQEMQGRVTILTDNRRLLARLFDRLWDLVKNS